MTDIPPKGTILRAANGDVIGYDGTGLVLHLSDVVIADIAARLAPPAPAPKSVEFDLDIDAWDISQRGDWFYFSANLPGADGPRGYRRHRDHPTILAQSHVPLMGILAIGGARAGLATAGQGRYPYHVMAPADDIGAVGMGGAGEATDTAHLDPLREMTHEALLAETLLTKGAARPLVFVRAETDMAASAAELGQGRAVANLEMAARNLIAAATHLGQRAHLRAVCLDYCLEDLSGDPIAYRDGMLALMERLTRSFAQIGLAAPVFLSGFDCGTQRLTHGPALQGQWELSWNHGAHQVIFSAPSYAFEIDDTGRLTDQGRRQKAEIGAAALLAHQSGARWTCPRLHLAEWDGQALRVTCAAMENLVLDRTDPFGAGKGAGFRLDNTTAKITSLRIDPKDPKTVILRLSARPKPGAVLCYAYGAVAGKGRYPANAGALRDTWAAPGSHGDLHRWALPARLNVTGL